LSQNDRCGPQTRSPSQNSLHVTAGRRRSLTRDSESWPSSPSLRPVTQEYRPSFRRPKVRSCALDGNQSELSVTYHHRIPPWQARFHSKPPYESVPGQTVDPAGEERERGQCRGDEVNGAVRIKPFNIKLYINQECGGQHQLKLIETMHANECLKSLPIDLTINGIDANSLQRAGDVILNSTTPGLSIGIKADHGY